MRSALVLACVLLGTPALAKEGDLVLAERLVLRSTALGQEREIWVHLPPGYAGGKARHQVLYVLDGQALILPVAGALSVLARAGQAPPVIVVGVSSTTTEDRRQNFDPKAGADRFVKFLVDELRPHIDRTYRTKPFQILAGHSLAGLLTLHAFATRPAAFSAYLALSPVLGRDDRAILRSVEAQVAKSPKALLYAAMGDEGFQFPRADFEALTAILGKARAPLAASARHFGGEDHMTTPIPALWGGLRFVYEGWAAVGASVAELEAHGKRISDRFGEPVVLPEDAWNRAGYDRLQAKDPPGAVVIFERMTREYPQSANAWDSLAEGYEAAGRLADARRAVDRAVKLLGADDPNRTFILEHQDKLRRASR
jgi:uncharacterized protein